MSARTAAPPTIYDVVELPEREKDGECQMQAGPSDAHHPCGNPVEFVFVYAASERPYEDDRRNMLACQECIPTITESVQAELREHPGRVNYGTAPEALSVETLTQEYRELNERKFSRTQSERDADRRMKVWNELRERSDVKQPECPECGGRNWGFTDHTECMSCGYGPTDEQLLSDIQIAWNQISVGGGET